MTPAELIRTFERHKRRSGIHGVALGPKEVGGSTEGCPLSVTFFVSEKLPVRGAKRRLADGRMRLPKFVELQGTTIPTDVVVASSGQDDDGQTRSPPQIFRAGGKVSNMQLTGTIGCLVRQTGSAALFALTNRHIALDVGTVVAFPEFGNPQMLGGTTSASVGLIADEKFLPVFDAPEAYIDVDAALVRIPTGVQGQFSPDIPNYGRPGGVYLPSTASQAAYATSLLNRPVFAYSWKSGPREGSISHVYYVYQQSQTGMQRVACFLVKSADDSPPGLGGDSGKVWMTKQNGVNCCIGLHSGVVADSPTSSRFAMATEFSSLAKFLKLSLV